MGPGGGVAPTATWTLTSSTPETNAAAIRRTAGDPVADTLMVASGGRPRTATRVEPTPPQVSVPTYDSNISNVGGGDSRGLRVQSAPQMHLQWAKPLLGLIVLMRVRCKPQLSGLQ